MAKEIIFTWKVLESMDDQVNCDSIQDFNQAFHQKRKMERA